MARIVHIEDDPANRLLVRKLLGRAGHEVIEAEDGIAGVRACIGQRPDLVLVDLNIPGLDGFEVTLRLRGERSLKGVPIVAITAEGDREVSLSVGCDGFLQKPIDAKTFADTILRYLGGQKEALPAQHQNQRLREQSQRIVAHLEQKVAELSLANERLRELDAARSAFYRNVSHELATPMTPIVGYVKLLHDEELGPLVPPQKRALVAMQECVARLRQIIDNLLDVTGLETGRMRFTRLPYDFGELARRAVERQKERFSEAGVLFSSEIGRAPMPAIGDGERLLRAVGQLLDNACKFTPKGGKVGLRVDQSEGRYELCVADTGMGIPADRQRRIFEAFYQVDGSVTREHGGTGVGLAIARRTARGLGGDVRVSSPCDEAIAGERFTGAAFYLSVAERAPEHVDAGSDPRAVR